MKNANKKVRIITAVFAALAGLVTAAAVACCIIFPNKYARAINAAADEFGLDRALVKSVVWAESKFDKNAVSNKGASGLMQIMPDTFEQCRKALAYTSDEADMFDPECSLRCGCYYLSLMIDKFDGDLTAALMAYNAGEANAKKFMDGAQVFPETQKYLKDIAFAARFYTIVNN